MCLIFSLAGYLLSVDGKSCVDIDECYTRTHACQQVCVNQRGSYRCECNTGYTLNNDGKTCTGKVQPKTTSLL